MSTTNRKHMIYLLFFALFATVCGFCKGFYTLTDWPLYGIPKILIFPNINHDFKSSNTYQLINQLGNDYYWATTNCNDDYSAALLAPNGSRKTDFKYQLYWDDAIGQTPWVNNKEQVFIETKKFINGELADILLFMDGSELLLENVSVISDYKYVSKYGIGYKLENGLFSILDFNTKKISDTIVYDDICGRTAYPIVKKGAKWGSIDLSGKIISPLKYDKAYYCWLRHFAYNHKTTYVSIGETNCIIELSTGKELLRTKKMITDVCTENMELWLVGDGSNSTQYSYIDGSLNRYCNPTQPPVILPSEKHIITNRNIYEDIKEIHNGHFPAKVNGKWGIFHIDGRCIVPAAYDKINHSSEMW